MLKYLKVFIGPIVLLLIIGFSLTITGCSSLYEYVPPSIVSFGESKVAVAHKNKWRFGKITMWLVRQKLYEKPKPHVLLQTKLKLYFIAGTVMIGLTKRIVRQSVFYLFAKLIGSRKMNLKERRML